MKRQFFAFAICLGIFGLLPVAEAHGQSGFTGPGNQNATGQVQAVTVSQAKNLPNKSLVILNGNIVQAIGNEKYTFRDSTGDITVEIDWELWPLLGLSAGVNDKVEIRGKMEVKTQKTEIDVKYIRKL